MDVKVTRHIHLMDKRRKGCIIFDRQSEIISACQTPRSMYPFIFNSFQVIQTASAKNRSFHVPQPTFLFPLVMPMGQSR